MQLSLIAKKMKPHFAVRAGDGSLARSGGNRGEKSHHRRRGDRRREEFST
jgi:hypothetical protein